MKKNLCSGLLFSSLLVFLCLPACSDASQSDPLPDGDEDVYDGDLDSDLDVGEDIPEIETEVESSLDDLAYPLVYTEEREPCSGYNPLRSLYFGDLHAHTRFSWDAYGYDMRVTAEEAYDYAKGEPVHLPPLDVDGVGTRESRIDRPLDFFALSDHIEYYGEYRLCTTPGTAVYDTPGCQAFREGGQDNVTLFGIRLAAGNPERMVEICGADWGLCKDAAKEVWSLIRQAAEEAYDRSSECRFVSFASYEYTGSPGVVNFHRNVLFRNGEVPDLPPSYYDRPTPEGLWAELESACLDREPCDVIVMPHNSNWSNGNMFTPYYSRNDSLNEQREAAKRRARIEPVVEAFQHKGDMECKNGFEGIAYDPYCDFEKIREADFADCGDKPGGGGANGFGCISRLDYIRNVYKFGLEEKRRLGFNPYKFGVLSSTDTHNATPGNVSERHFPGHVGLVDDVPQKRLGRGTLTHNPRAYNPGGLAAVWALEKSRDAIFEAMRRGEIYVSSGPRISLRFFGGWDYPDWLCDQKDWVEIGYRSGVPMGGDLPQRPEKGGKPIFMLKAQMDAGTEADPGAPLQLAQIVKGWIDAEGETHEKTFDVAGNGLNGADVDENTCQRSGEGHESLCAVWADEEFDPTQDAFYYLRVLEVPTCRWTAYDCATAGNEPDGCSDPAIPKTQRERAWSTPIWYEAQ